MLLFSDVFEYLNVSQCYSLPTELNFAAFCSFLFKFFESSTNYKWD